MTYKLFLDDERFPVGDDWVIARNIDDFMDTISIRGIPAYISFDHDLGDNTPNGHQIVQKMIDFMMNNDLDFPVGFDYYVHSQNPVGKKNIESLMDGFMKFWSG